MADGAHVYFLFEFGELRVLSAQVPQPCRLAHEPLHVAENLTLPLGAVEEQTWFWATSRLSFSTLGIYAVYVKNGQKHKVYFHYVSQILDHTALHACVALKDCLERLNLPPSCSCVQVWTDCGPHFRAYAFVASAVDLLRNSNSLTSMYFNYFGEHHGKGRNDGQFGLQRKWLGACAERNVISTAEELLSALREGARDTMLNDPPPAGPQYEIVHFHPEKPRSFLYLDTTGKEFNIAYTYSLAFQKTTSTNFPVRMRNYIYTDRITAPNAGRDLGVASVLKRESDEESWRTARMSPRKTRYRRRCYSDACKPKSTQRVLLLAVVRQMSREFWQTKSRGQSAPKRPGDNICSLKKLNLRVLAVAVAAPSLREPRKTVQELALQLCMCSLLLHISGTRATNCKPLGQTTMFSSRFFVACTK